MQNCANPLDGTDSASKLTGWLAGEAVVAGEIGAYMGAYIGAYMGAYMGAYIVA